MKKNPPTQSELREMEENLLKVKERQKTLGILSTEREFYEKLEISLEKEIKKTAKRFSVNLAD